MSDDICEKLVRFSKFKQCMSTDIEVEAAIEITRLREENARLRVALMPFAARLDELEQMKASKYACATSVEIEHLRAAAAAIRDSRNCVPEGGKG